MALERFQNFQIFRPGNLAELEIHNASESHLRSEFNPGRYTKKEEINAILKHLFKFYEKLLAELLPLIASRDFLEFVLYQYEIASRIEGLYKGNKLNNVEAREWLLINKTFRRAAKYLAERIVLLPPNEKTSEIDADSLVTAEKVWICAEELVNLYVVSDQTHSIFPDESYLDILPRDRSDYFKQGLSIELPDAESRVYLDSKNRERFIPSPSFIFDAQAHEEIIGQAFKESVGVTSIEAFGLLSNIIERSLPDPNGLPIPFVNKRMLIDNCSKLLGISKEAVEKVISGFTISKHQMEKEGRELWKPKQEYRAYRRAFFEYPFNSEPHLTFSKEMAMESFVVLRKDIIFKKMPSEWLTSSLEKSLSGLSNEAGKWFEIIVEDNLKKLNYIGIKSAKRGIGLGDNRITIPPEVGEIDYIGYSEKESILLLGECKLVGDTFEPKLFRDDIYEFVTSKKSYANKFRKKVEWVRNNSLSICKALESTGLYQGKISSNKIAGVIITFIPTIATHFIKDYPCVSLTEFMLDYERKGTYPY